MSFHCASDAEPLEFVHQIPDMFVFLSDLGGLTFKWHCLFPKQEGCRDTEDIRHPSQEGKARFGLVVLQKRQIVLRNPKKFSHLSLSQTRRNANELYAFANIHKALP
ncbi:MAG: hypothetical protein A2Y76_05280 [Planctomycetes bacterium RBG_13_60_9]|nr:MAG: hypothetical protein A2Y76_05280 [Planctomycetes bacterium RBG_13_60_9]